MATTPVTSIGPSSSSITMRMRSPGPRGSDTATRAPWRLRSVVRPASEGTAPSSAE